MALIVIVISVAVIVAVILLDRHFLRRNRNSNRRPR